MPQFRNSFIGGFLGLLLHDPYGPYPKEYAVGVRDTLVSNGVLQESPSSNLQYV